jgi:hypothetical protein
MIKTLRFFLLFAMLYPCSSIHTAPTFTELVEKEAPLRDIFETIYHQALWSSGETLSGYGSMLATTKTIQKALPKLLDELEITTIIDAPCGDFNWMRTIDFTSKIYLGIDIVPDIIKSNNQKYGAENIKFFCLDITTSILPQADIIICRDCFAHLTFEKVLAALSCFKQSGSRYLLATTHQATTHNYSTKTGFFSPYNLELPPFNLPKPLLIIEEISAEPFSRGSRKSLALWELKDL